MTTPGRKQLKRCVSYVLSVYHVKASEFVPMTNDHTRNACRLDMVQRCFFRLRSNVGATAGVSTDDKAAVCFVLRLHILHDDRRRVGVPEACASITYKADPHTERLAP